jgi:D-alanyl-D-alanine carboxypeptidase
MMSPIHRGCGLAVGLALLLASPPAASAPDDVPARIDAIVETFRTEEPSAGIAVAVSRGDAVVFARAYGFANLEHRVPATTDTMFRIASVSKQFTAMAVLMLAERGQIDLDAPLSTYFAEFPTTGPVPTVAQLINHTSGLNFEEVWARTVPPSSSPVDEPWGLTRTQLGELFRGVSFDYPPGQRFRYNNNAYEVAGLLIERVTGQSLASYLEKEIWRPLGMNRTFFVDTARVIAERASGYTLRGHDIINAPYRNLNGNAASGALGSTVNDLMIWQRALLSNRLIGPAMTRRMRTPGQLSDGTPIPYGLGLFLLEMEGVPKVEHYGNMTGTRAQLAYYPSADMSVTVLANMNPLRTDVLESRISRMLLRIAEKPAVVVPMAAENLRLFAGDYVVTDAPISHRSVTVPVTWESGRLVAGRFPLQYVGNNTFVPEGDPYHRYSFTVEEGRPVGLKVVRETRLIADARRR